MSDNWNTGSWRPPSDNSSYFNNVNQQKVDEIRASVTVEIREQAEKILHDIVTQKDKEIADLKAEKEKLQTEVDTVKKSYSDIAFEFGERLERQQKKIDSLKREKRHFDIPEEPEFIPEPVAEFIEGTPQDFLNGLDNIIKYNKSPKGFKQVELEKIRKIVLSWKRFLEEYKWKSNYISVKIKKLLLDTEKIWEE